MVKACAVRGALCAGLLIAGPTALSAQDDVIGISVGATPPAVTIEDLDGNPVELGRWVGRKPVLVEFWATWCPVCEELLPRMEAAQRRFGDRVEFLVVAVAVNQNKNGIRRHLTRHPMPFTFLWDVNGNATRAFQAPATSYIVALDAGGNVVYTGIGADQDLERALEKATARR
ncbi:MAG: TlpA disulfide reductase family protein [Gemmatimonadales bacterium]|nr:TlpA disulfide reductase family protein [Gemmatimonadales bacterium]